MQPGHPIMMAGIAQRMLRILALNCPPNYHCGGPAYAATSAVDAILHLMGIGVAMLQRTGRDESVEHFEKYLRENAVSGDTVIDQFMEHKSKILSSAMHCVLSDLRRKKFRECDEVTELALLSVMKWYFKKSGMDPKEFVKKLDKGNFDYLETMEKEDEEHMGKEAS